MDTWQTAINSGLTASRHVMAHDRWISCLGMFKIQGCTQQHAFVGTETSCFWVRGKRVQGANGKIPLNIKMFTGHLLSAQNVKEHKRPSEFSLASSEFPESCLHLNELPILWIFIADLSYPHITEIGQIWVTSVLGSSTLPSYLRGWMV